MIKPYCGRIFRICKLFLLVFTTETSFCLPTRDKILLRSLLQIIACDVIFTCGMIELLMVCFVFVSVDHPECEACYLETLEQDNYHQGKSSLIMLFLSMFSMHSRSPSLPNSHAS